ncbi:MAG: aminoacyl-tRNA hydrolase [Acidobacteriaceae bacterium]|nr:aminoacyl-tRNA hydrolase [Acidobacteriaceae bacterium]
MCCIAGLGNPGSWYERTPHNIGFLVIDELARRHALRITRSEGQALVGSGLIRDKSVVLVKPQTFMNLSGSAIGPVLRYRNLTNRELIVIYDELDLPWTALRIKKNGSAAGHNGVKSIIAALKTDVFTRVRVGIHPGHPVDAASYVLAPFERDMEKEVEEVVSYTADAAESIVAEGAVKAMAKYNRRARGIQQEEE